MRMIPADDLGVGVVALHDGLDMRPRLGLEGDLSGAFGGAVAADGGVDEQVWAVAVAKDVTDQDAADLGLGGGFAVGVDVIEDTLLEHYLKAWLTCADEAHKVVPWEIRRDDVGYVEVGIARL